MSPLEVIQLVGYSTGAIMTLWMCALLIRRKRLGGVETTLIGLGLVIGIWHTCNLIVTLHAFLGVDTNRWDTLLRATDTAAVISITLSYSLLLHFHIHLWADFKKRSLNKTEKIRVYLTYIPAVFLPLAISVIWHGTYQPMLAKFREAPVPPFSRLTYLTAFSLWAAYALCYVSVTDLLLARKVAIRNEKRFLITLAISFMLVAVLVFAHGVAAVGVEHETSEYLKTLASLGALLPAGLVGYYIYRYRYLELVIRDSLVLATFSVVVLTLYLLFIRSIGSWLTARYSLRSGAVESLLILGLALIAVPLRRWLDRRFHKMFKREASLYRNVIARIADSRGHYLHLRDLLQFIEAEAAESLGLRRIRIVALHLSDDDKRTEGDLDLSSEVVAALVAEIERTDAGSVNVKDLLLSLGFDRVYLLKRENRVVGVMLIAAADEVLTPDAITVLEVLSGQVAIAIEDSLIIEHNVRLERELAHKEQLAALGQMAATVAHEVKNPLSAIKSIAQVMREDKSVVGEYGRDLDLIVGETDRLNQSVSQLLSFSRKDQPHSPELTMESLVSSVREICRSDAAAREIDLSLNLTSSVLLTDGVSPAIKDAVVNLVFNGIHASPRGGKVALSVDRSTSEMIFVVEDSGTGVPSAMRSRIWEPFFTTKQRGTGLGLSIVKKRLEESGGYAVLKEGKVLSGARFEVHLPNKQGQLRDS